MLCPKCGAQNEDDKKFCGYCGTQLPGQQPVESVVAKDEGETSNHQVEVASDNEIQEDKSELKVHGASGTVSATKQSPRKIKIAVMLVGITVVAVAIGGIFAYVLWPDSPKVVKKPKRAPTQEETIESYWGGIRKYKEMSVETFEELPRNERLIYSEFIKDLTVSRGTYAAGFGKDKPGEAYAIEPVVVSVENNGQEIINNYLYSEQISYLQFIEGAEKPYDKVDGIKTLSSVYYDVGDDIVTKDYANNKTELESLDKASALLNKYTTLNTSSLINGQDINSGEAVKYKDVTYKNQDSEIFYARFIYCEFKNYKNQSQAVWLLGSQ